jgi:hypothetical protein
MRTVRDGDGNHYLLLKESAESSLVRDPISGDQRHLPNDDIEPVDGESPLVTATVVVPDTVRDVLTAVPDERALGLLLEVDRRGPVSVRLLLDAYDLCESDLHGLIAEFRAAGLVEASTGDGRRYDTTESASSALGALREE